MKVRKPIRGSRYLTGERPLNQGIQLYAEEDGTIVIPTILDERHEGPPNCVHGGFSASLIDEAMGGAVWHAGYKVVAVHLDFDLRLAVPLGEEVTVRGRVERVEGRKVYTSGEITLADGRVAVEGSGIFVEAPQLFAGDASFGNIFS